jgi:hypothetical protein
MRTRRLSVFDFFTLGRCPQIYFIAITSRIKGNRERRSGAKGNNNINANLNQI